MLAAAFALALLAADPAPKPQTAPQTAPVAPPEEGPTRLGDVEVTGRPLDEMIADFVETVAAPAHARGLARWRSGLCVSVVNMRQPTAQYMADRISANALALGLRPGEPGCRPNVVVIATVDATTFTHQYVASRPRLFRIGGGGMDRGGGAFEDFQNTDRPVRWWTVSMPVDGDTGQRATRLPGEVDGDAGMPGSAMDYAPKISVFSASRLRTEVVDDMVRAIVIIDMDRLGETNQQQLADYVAMVALAQVDPKAETRGYASILNVFQDPENAPELTDWDKAYLEGLYGAERSLSNHASYLREVRAEIGRAHARLRDASAETE